MDDRIFPSPARTPYQEAPKLTGAIVGSVVAAICFTVALFFCRPDSAWRFLFVVLGGIALLYAMFYALDWALWRSGAHIQRIREAAYGPQLEMARLIQGMDNRKLEILESGGYLKLRPGPKLVDGGVHWLIEAPGGVLLPLPWIYEYMEKCAQSFPMLPSLHGLNDNTERTRRSAFHRMITNPEWNLAKFAVGNKACEWTVVNIEDARAALRLT